jgi:DNA-binding response OmpR family regulator
MVQAKTEWVLLVEDDNAISESVTARLRDAGYKVIVASSVNEASVKLGQQKFSCIVTDLVLGKGSGEDLIFKLDDKRSLNFKVPILIVSAYVEADLIKRVGKKVNGVLVKPFRIEMLVDKVNQLILTHGPSMGDHHFAA